MSSGSLIFEKQGLHLGLLAILLAAASLAARALDLRGEAQAWFALAIGSAIVHQAWVWLCWRLELHTHWVSRTFGPTGFRLYAAGFALLAALRFVGLIGLAVADRGSFASLAQALTVFGIVSIAPIVYLFYSVARYFGFRRALGADHFDPAYRKMALEKRGIFRYTRNGMYTYGLLVVWLPGLFAASKAALVAAAFHHAYIWVHYYCTEAPDMRRIYGERLLSQDKR